MKRFFKIPLLLILVFLIAAAGFYFLSPLVTQPDLIHKKIVQYVEEATDSTFTFRDVTFSYFPTLTAVFDQVILDAESPQKVFLEAKRLKIRLRILDLLLGRVRVARLAVEHGDAKVTVPVGNVFQEIEIKNLNLELKPWQAKRPMRLVFEGDLEGLPKAFSGEMIFTLDELGEWDWKSSSIEGGIELRNLHLVELKEQLQMPLPIEIQKGQFACHISLSKKKGESWSEITSKMNLNEFVYQLRGEGSLLTSNEINTELDITLAWNPDREELLVKESRLVTPIGKMELRGALIREIMNRKYRFGFSKERITGIKRF